MLNNNLNEAEIISIKRLRKDGSLNKVIIDRIIRSINNAQIIVLPVDNIYSIIGLPIIEVKDRIKELIKTPDHHFDMIISSSRMLDEIAFFTKRDYDFLNKIWPGEVTVYLKAKEIKKKKGFITDVAVRYPKTKFLLEVMKQINRPLLLTNASISSTPPIFDKKEIVKTFNKTADLIIIVDEICKKYPLPTVIDISSGELKIKREGKVSFGEIESLFFLGKDDDIVY